MLTDYNAENPLRKGMRIRTPPPPCTIIIFGATGDLTRRKLMPALYSLALENRLPIEFSVVGFARREKTHEQFREEMRQAVDSFSRNRPVNEMLWQRFSEGIYYHRSEFDNLQGYQELDNFLNELDSSRKICCNRIYYLATPPQHFPVIIKRLGESSMAREKGSGFSHIVIEKPFGRDLPSARELNIPVQKNFREDQIYRIDHYLGKETVQNIMVFRFANGIFEPIWNHRYIDHVQITVSEDIGVETRGAYYDKAGALRDMIQNHILQLLCLVAMEPPVTFAANAVRDEKVKVLKSIRPILAEDVGRFTIRGQYGPGWSGGGEVVGYCKEPGVAKGSSTETYAAIKVFLDNWRWAGVPFYLRTGKRLPKRVTEIAIQFKRAPHLLFSKTYEEQLAPNVLTMRIQPDEGISLKFGSKAPGEATNIRQVSMEFRYETSFGAEPPEAYERLILDCILGDSTLFTRSDEVEAAWSLITPILQGWEAHPEIKTFPYESGTWGPSEADAFIQQDGRVWRKP